MSDVGTNGPRSIGDTVPWRGQGTVLLIDDDYYVRLVTATILRSFGLKVETVSDGRAGLAAWKAIS